MPRQTPEHATIPGSPSQIDLVGVRSNRDGIGSLIRIDTDEYRRFYIFEPGGTTNSSNERLFTVGVGQHKKVSVKVLFPSGKQVSRNNVSTNSRITIQESE